MNKRLKYTHITNDEFNNIKKLQHAGISANQVSKVTKRAHRVIANIFRSDTLDDYKKVASKHNKKAATAVVVDDASTERVNIAATETISEVIRQAKLKNAIVLTTHAAFIGFDDLYDFIKEASDNDVTVTFAPIGK